MTQTLEAFADQLYTAELKKQSVSPLIEQRSDLTIEDAYRIQMLVLDRKLAAGARVVGKKTGLTSQAMQQMLQVNRPDFGHLTDGMVYEGAVAVPVKDFLQPRVEPEIAFVLKKDLKGPGVTVADVMRATDYVVPALEVIDSRIRDWKISIVDTIADNASSGGFVVGSPFKLAEGIDLRLVGMNFYVNGRLVSTATGAAVLGNPFVAVAWLANALAPLDVALRTGEIILSGSLCAAVPVTTGDSVLAMFDRLGSIGAFFE